MISGFQNGFVYTIAMNISKLVKGHIRLVFVIHKVKHVWLDIFNIKYIIFWMAPV